MTTVMEDRWWWIDVGIEISSPHGHCIQQRTAGYCTIVHMALEVTEQKTSIMTQVSHSRQEKSQLFESVND